MDEEVVRSHAITTNPCVKVCKVSAEHGYCGGCKRTSAEIKQWRFYSDEMREAVLEDIQDRDDI